MPKAKIPISIDPDLLEKIRLITATSKGGVSGWINEACQRKIKNEGRAKKRKAVFYTARKEGTSNANGN
ncbi:MAG: hypothetical protein K0R17_3561 [Rariglobus sp.]|jgi:hypothetical protein|nr:hypothetical protein [Rariglobus sp.]